MTLGQDSFEKNMHLTIIITNWALMRESNCNPKRVFDFSENESTTFISWHIYLSTYLNLATMLVIQVD